MMTQSLANHSFLSEGRSSAVRRVLIVDADPVASDILTEILRSDSSPAEPVAVESGKAALRILQANEKIDLLLADLALPDMDGLELLASARAVRPELRLAAMTASPSEEALRAAFEHGALRLLAKPLDVEDLLASLLDDRPGAISHLEGDLDLADLCRLSVACQSDGGLRLRGEAGEGTLIHRGATLIYAAAGELTGLEAFHDLSRRSPWLFDSKPVAASHVPVNCELALAEAPRQPGARAAGTLRRLTLRHLIEWAMRGHRTCDLTVTSQSRTGVLSFEAGKIRSAATSGREGGLAAAEILTWENLRVTVVRSLETGAEETGESDFPALIDRFCADISGFLGTGVVRRQDRSPVGGRADASHLASNQTAAAFSRVVDRHLAAVEILGGTEVWGDTEDILITTGNAYLLLRMLGASHYQWLAVSREANLGMCRLMMRSFETFFLGELANLGEIG